MATVALLYLSLLTLFDVSLFGLSRRKISLDFFGAEL
jgi:hypothetical protein